VRVIHVRSGVRVYCVRNVLRSLVIMLG